MRTTAAEVETARTVSVTVTSCGDLCGDDLPAAEVVSGSSTTGDAVGDAAVSVLLHCGVSEGCP